jgi:hypothetical protein
VPNMLGCMLTLPLIMPQWSKITLDKVAKNPNYQPVVLWDLFILISITFIMHVKFNNVYIQEPLHH